MTQFRSTTYAEICERIKPFSKLHAFFFFPVFVSCGCLHASLNHNLSRYVNLVSLKGALLLAVSGKFQKYFPVMLFRVPITTFKFLNITQATYQNRYTLHI